MPERSVTSESIRMHPVGIAGFLARRPALAKIVRNVAWLSVDQVLRMGLGLAVGVWMARYLGPEQYGRLSYALAFVGLFGAVGALGLQSVVVRDIIRRQREPGVILGSAVALQLAAGVVALMMALGATVVFAADDGLLRASIVILAVALPFRATDVVRYWFESQVESRYVVWVENGVFVAASAARIAFILAGAGLLSFVFLAMVETVVVSLGLLWAYARRAGPLSAWTVERSTMRSLLADSWPYLLAAVAVTLYMRMDVVMLQQMSSSYEVGVYSAAAKLSELLYVLPSIFVASISPAIIGSHQADRALYLTRMKQLYAGGWWYAVGTAAALSFLAPAVVGLAFGRDFSDAATVLAIHVWGSIAVIHGIASSQHLLVENLQKVSFYRTAIGLCCNFVLNLAWIPAFGGKGAAWATVVSYFVATYSLLLFRATRGHALFMLASPFTRGASR